MRSATGRRGEVLRTGQPQAAGHDLDLELLVERRPGRADDPVLLGAAALEVAQRRRRLGVEPGLERPVVGEQVGDRRVDAGQDAHDLEARPVRLAVAAQLGRHEQRQQPRVAQQLHLGERRCAALIALDHVDGQRRGDVARGVEPARRRRIGDAVGQRPGVEQVVAGGRGLRVGGGVQHVHPWLS
jgi:hypothetical protein